MNRNQKIALGCGGAGCLGLILLVIVVRSAYRHAALSRRRAFTVRHDRNYNYNYNYNSNYNSNTNPTPTTIRTPTPQLLVDVGRRQAQTFSGRRH